MSTEVICVDDSSDEEDVLATCCADSTRMTRGALPPSRGNIPRVSLEPSHNNNSSSGGGGKDSNGIVDLCDSDDNESSPNDNEAEFCHQIEMAKKASLTLSNESANHKTRIKKRKKAPPRVSTSKPTAASTSSRFHPSDLDSDSDSDYSLLQSQWPNKKPSAKPNGFANKSSPSSSSLIATSTATPKSVTVAVAQAPSSGSSSTKIKKPIVNPYRKSLPAASTSYSNSNPSSNDSVSFPYPKLLPHSTQYRDFRAYYALAFWKNATRNLTYSSHNAEKLEQAVKKVVKLSLIQFPIRSLEEFYLRGKKTIASDSIIQTNMKNMQMQLAEGGLDNLHLPVGSNQAGHYFSIAEACLVAMATEIDRRLLLQGSTSSGQRSLPEKLASKDMYVSVQFLIPEIDKRLHKLCPARILRKKDPDGGVAYYLNSSTRSAEFLQIKKLQTPKLEHCYIKSHQQNKQPVYELTPLGYKTAKWIQRRVFPAPCGNYRTSLIETVDQVEPHYRDIFLCVDRREGGQKPYVLHRMCNKLDTTKVPYFVGSLGIGDYCFIYVGPGPNYGKLCPILVERKSIQDVAKSMADGRWTAQKQRMYHGQFVFGYDNCRMVYIIEGKEEQQQVTGGYIGRRSFNVDRQTLDNAIQSLESEGFEVERTPAEERTMFILARWARTVAEDVRSEKLKLEFTYEQFKAEVKKIPPETDFSRLAKYHMEQKLASEQQVTNRAANMPSNPSIVDNCIDLLSDDDEDESNERVSTGVTSMKRKQKGGEVTPKSNSLLGAAYSSKAKDVRSEPRFKPSKEVASYFSSDINSDDSCHVNFPSRSGANIAGNRKPEGMKERKRKRESMEKALPTKASRKTEPSDDSPAEAKYKSWTLAQLQAACEKVGLPKSGKKENLIRRLQGPKPPQVWLERKKRGEYVPKRPFVAATALLVALYLHEREHDVQDIHGLTEDELIFKSDELDIKKDPMCGGSTQTGPYIYHGFCSMNKLLQGDPPLVIKKNDRYKLTRCSDLAGYNFAKAMHKWCHDQSDCKCKCGMSDFD